ncbi:MAG TPA: hypothetical protein VKZ18_02290 [Polyangia bacterium]|nr:hypothetical protein [Polyangia bacterium]
MTGLFSYARFGVDSLGVGTALGATRAATGAELRVVALFGAADAAATVAAGQGASGALAFVLLALAGVVALGGLRRPAGRAFALLALTGVDNLVAPRPWRDGLAAGIASAALAGVGLLIVGPLLAAVWRRVRPRPFARS